MTFHVDADRLGRSRFVISRLAEVTNALEVLAHPERAPHAHGWISRTRRGVDRSHISVLYALFAHNSYVPDFIVPVPTSHAPTIEEELATVAATPADVIAWQLRCAFQIGPRPQTCTWASGWSRPSSGTPDRRPPLPHAVARTMAEGGETGLAACVSAQLGHLWRMTLADSWSSVRRVFDEDIRNRATWASQMGFAEIVRDLHPRVDWDGRRITIQTTAEVTVDASAGVALTPSTFLHRPAMWLGDSGRVLLGYPARARGAVWSAPPQAAGGANLIGGRRAALLADLEVARSTTELAERHQLAAATVSYHLDLLRRSGLVTKRRAGHCVLYERTTHASVLLATLHHPHDFGRSTPSTGSRVRAPLPLAYG